MKTIMVLCCLLFCQAAFAAEPRVVTANLPLTGPLGAYGTAIKEGAEIALGRPDVRQGISVAWEDNAGNPSQAAAIARLQLAKKPFAGILGIKPQYMAAAGAWRKSGAPFFAWVFDADVRKTGGSKAYRSWVNYRHEPELYFTFVRSLRAKKVAVLYVRLPHTEEEFEKAVIPRLKKDGVSVFAQSYNIGNTDFRVIVSKLRNFAPDAIILNGFQQELVAQVRALRESGIHGDSGRIMATYDMMDAAQLLSAKELEGIRFSAPGFAVQPTTPEAREFRQLFRDRFGREPLYTSAYAYDMILALARAARGESLDAVSFRGASGQVTFDANGDIRPNLAIGVFRNGKPTLETQPAR